MRILLVCSAGMSTSALVKRMTEAAAERGLEVEVRAESVAAAKRYFHQTDIVLLGPQVRFLKDEMAKTAGVPVQVIDMRAYGRMDGAKVLADAIDELEQQ